ncbi:MAG TPA: hypothetical protein VFE05_08260 [Longimicrobiaceae bacterium]|nr:hypothetical protein [Longimicrobiaceae bacterium]
MRHLKPFAVLLAVVAVCAAMRGQDPWREQVRRQLIADAAKMAEYDLTLSHDIMFGDLNSGYQSSFSVQLRGGSTYFIIGECDGDCSDLDLKLYRGDGELLNQDVDDDDHPVIRITPRETRTFRIQPIMASCAHNPCSWGVGIFR